MHVVYIVVENTLSVQESTSMPPLPILWAQSKLLQSRSTTNHDVRCREEHSSDIYNMPLDSSARYALCHGSSNPDNFKGYSAYKKLKFFNSQTRRERVISTSKTRDNFPKSTLNSNSDKQTIICSSYFL